jgi:hypothetical protein
MTAKRRIETEENKRVKYRNEKLNKKTQNVKTSTEKEGIYVKKK